ncbi:nucleotidyltransferase family protein [Atopobacter phocae]|uniref:nucleotidyltransferase family protein n=1 Tax=Atopobacter phocae TaxID=136492 RepID=UPI0004721C8F|nr:nucleotidyltransferase family protein [Atopobacter phocae]
MRSVGIIAEFNPLHRGHQQLMTWAKEVAQADVVVIALSGNLVQRGEISFVDVAAKTEWALNSGADLVLLQPIWASLQATDNFAKHGIDTLRLAQVDSYAFGSEFGNAQMFTHVARLVNNYQKELDQLFHSIQDERLGYAQKMAQAYLELERHVGKIVNNESSLVEFLTHPNSQLGLAYEKWNQKSKQPLNLHVLRRNNSHHGNDLIQTPASGSDLRRLFQSDNSYNLIKEYPILNWVSDYQLKLLEEFGRIDTTTFWPLLKYTLMITEPDELETYYGVNEGIAPRLIRMAHEASSYEDWLNLVHHKRVTRQRIKRMSMSILFHLKKSDMKYQAHHAEHPRQVLGFTANGQKYLKELNAKQLVTNYQLRPHLLPIDWRVDGLIQDWFAHTGRYKRLNHPIRK